MTAGGGGEVWPYGEGGSSSSYQGEAVQTTGYQGGAGGDMSSEVNGDGASCGGGGGSQTAELKLQSCENSIHFF